jgi:hypothetical protein
VDRHGIVVAEPGTEFSVAYRREGSVLVADNLMQKPDPSDEELVFLVRALEGCPRQGAVTRLALLIICSIFHLWVEFNHLTHDYLRLISGTAGL